MIARLNVTYAVALRGAGLAARFLLLAFSARFLRGFDVGLLGLALSGVSFGLYPLGLDYYAFTTRELVASDVRTRRELLAEQWWITKRIYALLLLPTLLALYAAKLPLSVMPIIACLLIAEHASQESYRILVVLGRQVEASALLFLRLGAWVYAIVLLILSQPRFATLQVVLLAWLIGSGASAIIGWHLVSTSIPNWRSASPVRERIVRGLRVALPLLVGTLSIRALFFADRVLLGDEAGIESIGPYALYFGFVAAAIALQDSGVIAFRLPKMIGALRSGELAAAISSMREIERVTLLLILAGIICTVVLYPIASSFLPPAYSDDRVLLAAALLSATFFLLSMAPHTFLYSSGCDKEIVLSNIAALATLLLMALALRGAFLFPAVYVGSVAACAVLCVSKYMYVRRLLRRQSSPVSRHFR